MTNQQQLTLSLSPQAKATLSAFAVAKGLGQYQEAQRQKRLFEAKLASERRERELQQRREYYERLQAEEKRLQIEERHQWREEVRRLNEEAFVDAYEKFPTGRVHMWNLIRLFGSEKQYLSCMRSYHCHSNDGKRNCGRKPRRSW